MWLVGRLGILVVFGVFPIMRACDRVRHAPLTEAQRHTTECGHKVFAAFDETHRHPVNSALWQSNFAVAQFWMSNHTHCLSNEQRLYKEFYGKD